MDKKKKTKSSSKINRDVYVSYKGKRVKGKIKGMYKGDLVVDVGNAIGTAFMFLSGWK